MMKRFGNLYDKIYDYDNLKLAHKKARKDKSYYTEVKMIDDDEKNYLNQIHNMLKNKTYRVSFDDYTMFTKMDKGKEREIYKLDYFPHRIIQHALLNVIEDILYKSLISHTYSSIRNRGIHSALKDLNYDLTHYENDTSYCLKMDVQKFYPSINHTICKQLFRKKFKDENLLWLIDMLIDSMDGEKGIAIGSLFSQWCGNYYLSYFDHWLKENKHVKYYYRYCDDLVILDNDKSKLHNLNKEIHNYLSSKLDLQVKNTWQVFPVDIRGIDFVGYRHFRKYILLRKSTASNFKKKMKDLLIRCQDGEKMTYSDYCSVNSYDGWVKWCNGLNLKIKYINPLLTYTRHYHKYYLKEYD